MRTLTPAAWAALGAACMLSLTLTLTHFPAIADEPYPNAAPGGWTSASTQEEAVKKAARFAVQEQSRLTGVQHQLLAIKHARIQLLDGHSYSLNLMLQHQGKRRLAIAAVWFKPDGSMKLTRWHWV